VNTLAGHTIICLAPDPWEGLWRNRHQIMTRLARANTVLYVEPRLYFPETWRRLRDGRLKLADVLADFRRPLATRYADGLWIYHDPYYAPVSGRRSGGPQTAALRRRAMLRTLQQIGAPMPPILWLVRPFYADVIGQYNEKLVVYHVTDEYSAYASVDDRAAALRTEEAMLRRADLVIVTAPALLESKRPFNPHTYLVPNGVDYEGFQRAIAEVKSEKSKVKHLDSILPSAFCLPHSARVGYSGALNEKIDFELLAHVARTRPDWQLVLIGMLDLYSQPAKADVLKDLPNVQWLGRLPVTELPAAIASLDVCLLPYERNEWTANIDSLKLYEYMACGRPVVSTDVPTARGQGDLVRIADHADEFVAQIAAALAETDPALAERRKAFAAANTWDQRVARIEELLTEALARRR
jgi:glycosyltransferase involved in cell wall biosynthesis